MRLLCSAVAVAFLAVPALAADPDGKALYEKHCGACHGKDGNPPAPFVKLKAAKFADPAWHPTRTDEQVRKTLEDGVKGTTMASFRAKLTPEEMAAVIKHLRTLAPAK